MIEIKFSTGELPKKQQQAILNGFVRYSTSLSAPVFSKTRYNWLAYSSDDILAGALTAELLWDWIYVDELWVDESLRGKGLGKQLMEQVEQFSNKHSYSGIWLWTQSWQAPEFYKKLGYEEFARFDNFPKGHTRIGFRKALKAKY